MADTNSLIRFRFGTFQSIKDLGSKNQTDIYFASDSPTFYNAGLWYGVSSLTSSVNEETGEVTLTINGDLGEDWKGSQPVCTFVAGMTTEQKDNLKMVVDFVNSITTTEGEDTQTVIDKWNEIINFLEGFKDTDVLLDRIVTLETNVTNLQNTTINAGDGLKGGGNLTGNRTIALGTPSTITDSTINEAKGTTHTHAINKASTEQLGIVRLNDTLTSESTDQALTANQGKVLDGKVKGVADLLNDMFEKVTDNGKTYIKTKYGFASDKFVSAGGTDDTESGGGGGANLSQMWESLQHNNDTFKDRLINVAHIPTLTTGKISDYLTATQAIVNTAVENKADKSTTLSGYGITDAVKIVKKSANVSESCVGYTTADHNLQNGGLFTGLGADGLYGSQLLGNYVGTGLYYRGKNNGTWTAWKTIAFTDDVLPRTGGTLTGALTVNAPINNTGALKLLGASEVSSTGMAVGSGAKALGTGSRAFGRNSIANGSGAMAFGELAQAEADLSYVFAYSGISARVSQTVLGRYNEEDVNSLLVIGSGTSDTARKNIFTIDTNGYVRMGNRLHIGVGGQNEVYLHSDAADQLYVHTSAGIPLVIQGGAVCKGGTKLNESTEFTLGTDYMKWDRIYTEALKLSHANLTYDTGTLTIDKALKTTSTLTATQGEFANYVKIGNATISWNPKGYLEINEGLASHKFISAGGVVTGDAGGGGGGLSLTDMWVSLNGNIDAYGKSKIHIDHIPLDVILSHDDYENDVANRINTFNYSNSDSFVSAVKSLIVADNIPTLEMSKIDGLEDTLGNIGTVVQNNYETLSNLITNNHNDHEARIKAIEQALTWQTV